MSDHAGKQSRAPGAPATAVRPDAPAPGKHTLVQQLQAQMAQPDGAAGAPAVHAAASRGVATPASPLPHAGLIQRAFGRHDIGAIQAHTGAEASASARAMGAEAYAAGDHVVLGDRADLHTVAHEAAHVVQQRGGVQLKGGVGQVGDVHEQHADRVADLVVRGESAEAVLDQHAGGGAGSPSVQRVVRDRGGAPVQANLAALTPEQAQAMLVEIHAGNLIADPDDLAQLQRIAGPAPAPGPGKRKADADPGTDDGPAQHGPAQHGPAQHGPAAAASSDHKEKKPRVEASGTGAEPEQQGTRHVFETPAQYVARTGKHLLYRAVRMHEHSKKKFAGTGAEAGNTTENIQAPPDGNLFQGTSYSEREDKYRKLTGWPADAPIHAADPEAQADPLVQVAGGDRATQYISTGATKKGAAHNTVRSWNAAGSVDERPVRNPKSWAPVITIDVNLLDPTTKLYDIQRPGVNYMYLQDSLGMMSNLSAADAEVLIAGTIPAAAVVDILTAPRALADAAGVTVDDLKRRLDDATLRKHQLIDPEPPAAPEDEEPVYIPRSQRPQAKGPPRRRFGF